jgi:endonuclease/exonuclease/phosphatase family metal-dependent hydrolase
MPHRKIALFLAAASLALAGGAVTATARVALPAQPTPISPLCGAVGARDFTIGPHGSADTTRRPPRHHAGLRVGDANLLHGLTAEGDRTLEARLVAKADQFAAADLDVLGVQEASESPKHGLVISRLAGELAARTGLTWYWCWVRTEPHLYGGPDTRPGGGNALDDLVASHYNSNEKSWYNGPGVLSRWPITASAARRLPGEDIDGRMTGECVPHQDVTCPLDIYFETRSAVWTRIASPRGPISFTSSHTSGNSPEHADLASWARSKSAADHSAFITCDCNSVESSGAQATLRNAGWTDTYRALNRDAGNTADQDLSAAKPTVSARIDYVFARAGSALRLRTSKRFMNHPVRSTLTKTHLLWPSDHYGVITTFA